MGRVADGGDRRDAPDDLSLDPGLAVAVWVALAVGGSLLAGVLGGALTGSGLGVRTGATVARSGADAAAVACVGLALIGVLLPLGADRLPGSALRDLLRVQRRADRVLVAAAGAWLVLLVVGIVLRTADALGRSPLQLSGGEVLAWTTRLDAGRGMLLAAACAAAVLGVAVARVRRRDAVQVRVPAVVAVIGTLLPALTGHSGADPEHQLAVVAIALHVGAAAIWVGGLAALLVLVAGHRALLDNTLPRFSGLAAGCLLTVALSGLLNTFTRLDGPASLVSTGYGLLVAAKVVLLGAVAGLGWLTRRRLLAGRMPVLRWAGAEIAVMALTIGVAAALSQTPPPDGSHSAHGSPTGHQQHDQALPTGELNLWAVQSGPLGTVVVDTQYRIVYRSDLDSPRPPTSACLDTTCTDVWAPLVADGRSVVGRGVDQARIGTLDRPDGTRQVTLDGWPLYLRVGEPAGLASTGANGTDGVWFAVSPTGDKAAPG
ncbi:CopD family protein [Pseudonocardia lacus]|uniref:CopD family protein n=1 Tax=Pseudonocardia lacus TaxID=2835865 RepID=UPI001BDD8123|nr:CopD family protein [Pseudonocardia lacus]